MYGGECDPFRMGIWRTKAGPAIVLAFQVTGGVSPISMTLFCPSCWVKTCLDASICSRCGFRLPSVDAFGHVGKLLLALKHPVPEHRSLSDVLLFRRWDNSDCEDLEAL